MSLILLRKTIRDIWVNRNRILPAILAISVGVFLFGTLAAGNQFLISQYINEYTSGENADAYITLTGFDQQLVRQITSMDQVLYAEGRTVLGNLTLDLPDHANIPLQLHVVDRFDLPRLHQIDSLTVDSELETGGIYLERTMLSTTSLIENQIVTLVYENGETSQLEFGGTVNDIIELPYVFSGIGQGYINYRTLRDIEKITMLRTNTPARNRLYIKFHDDVDVQTALTRVTRRISTSGYPILATTYLTDEPPLTEVNQTLQSLINVALLLIFGADALLVSNIMSAIIQRQASHLGIIKSFGGGPIVIINAYLALAMVIGMTGFLIASLLTFPAAYGFATFLGSIADITVEGNFSVPTSVYLWQLVLAIGTPLLASILPIFQASQLTVISTLRDLSSLTVVSRWLAWLPLNIVGRLTVRGVFRRIFRLLGTTLALSFAGSLFIGAFGISNRLQSINLALVESYFLWDTQFVFDQQTNPERVTQLARRHPDVIYTETWSQSYVQANLTANTQSGGFRLIGLPIDSQFLQPRSAIIVEGEWFDQPEELFASENMLEQVSWPGTLESFVLPLTYGGNHTAVNVVGYAAKSVEGGTNYLAEQTFNQLVPSSEAQTILVVKTNQNTFEFVDRVQQDLLEIFYDEQIDVLSFQLAIPTIETFLSQANIVLQVLVIVSIQIAVIGIIGLSSTVAIQVFERRREIGILRSMGAGITTIGSSVLMESILMALLSIFGAWVLSYPIGTYLTIDLSQRLYGLEASYTLQWVGLEAWVIITILSGFFAGLGPAAQATRISVRDAMEVKE